MRGRTDTPAEFTGRHMFWTMLAFFGTIITVNLTMAFVANGSWTGLVVKNSYVASQEFNAKVGAARQLKARGWTGRLQIADGRITYALTDRQGQNMRIRDVTVAFRSPASDRDDRTVALATAGSGASGSMALADGIWIIEVTATAADGIAWHETRRTRIASGRPL